MASAPNVFRVNTVEEETDFRRAVHEVISLTLAEDPQRTLIDIAESIDVSVKTVSNAYNKTHSLSETFLRRIGKVYGPDKLNPWARLVGARLTPLTPISGNDILPFVQRVGLRIAEARDPSGPGGEREIHTERLGYLPDLRDLKKELMALISQIESESDNMRSAA